MAATGKRANEKTDPRHRLPNKLSTVQSTDVNELQRLTEELQIHQVELEIQNQALRDAQQGLESSRDRYVSLYDFAPVGYATIDKNGSIIEANLALAGLLAIERTKLIGSQFVTYVASEMRPQVRHCLRICRDNPDRHSCEAVLRRLDGKQITAQLIVERADNSPTCRIAAVDITERAEAQSALQESRSMLQNALQAARMIAWSWDLASNKVTQLSDMTDIFGLQTPDTYQIHGSMLKDIHPDDIDHYRHTMQSALSQGMDYVTEYRVRPSWMDRTFWLEEHGKVVLNAEGQASAVRGLLIDITARKVAEEGMVINYERLRSLLTESSDPVVLLGAGGAIECISKTGALMLGYEPEELVGKDAQTFIHRDDLRLASPQHDAMKRTGMPESAMLRVRQKGGELCWVDADVSVILPNSSNRGFMVVFRRLAIDIRQQWKPPATERGPETPGGK